MPGLSPPLGHSSLPWHFLRCRLRFSRVFLHPGWVLRPPGRASSLSLGDAALEVVRYFPRRWCLSRGRGRAGALMWIRAVGRSSPLPPSRPAEVLPACVRWGGEVDLEAERNPRPGEMPAPSLLQAARMQGGRGTCPQAAHTRCLAAGLSQPRRPELALPPPPPPCTERPSKAGLLLSTPAGLGVYSLRVTV